MAFLIPHIKSITLKKEASRAGRGADEGMPSFGGHELGVMENHSSALNEWREPSR